MLKVSLELWYKEVVAFDKVRGREADRVTGAADADRLQHSRIPVPRVSDEFTVLSNVW